MKHISKLSKSKPMLAGLVGVPAKSCDPIKDALNKDCVEEV